MVGVSFQALMMGQATAVDATVSFTDESGDNSALTTYTFLTQDFGAAATNRYIIVGVATRKSASTVVVSSMTIGGVAATSAAAVSWDGGDNHLSLWIAAVPTGTTGTVVVTLSEAADRCAIAVFRAVDLLSATPTATASDVVSADPLSEAITITAGGFAVAIAFSQNLTTATWTGLTEASDAQYEITLTSALLNSSAGGGVTASVDWAVANAPAILIAAWR